MSNGVGKSIVWEGLFLRINVGKKLAFSFLVILVIMSMAGTIYSRGITQLEERIASIESQWMPKVEAASQIDNHLHELAGLTLLHLNADDTEARAALEKERADIVAGIEQGIAKYAQAAQAIAAEDSAEERKLSERLLTEWKQFKQANDSNIELNRGKDWQKAMNAYTQSEKSFDLVNATIDSLVGLNQSGIRQAVADSREISGGSNSLGTTIGLIALVLAILIAVWLTLNLTRPLRKVTAQIKGVSDGRLDLADVQVRNRDEIGELAASLNDMVGNLRILIYRVMMASEQVASSSQQLLASAQQTTATTNHIVASVQEVAVGSETQQHSAGETVRAMEEMSVGIQRIAEVSGVVAEASTGAETEAAGGTEAIEQAVAGMDSVTETMRQLEETVKRLGERSEAIGQMVDLITNISNQTNLLALNAGIEAARAGEHGRGFAVVAQEVRKLATLSQQSAQQIVASIEEIQRDTTFAVEAAGRGTADVAAGAQAVREAGRSFHAIAASIRSMNEQVHEASAISQQMAASSEEVTASVVEHSGISARSGDLIRGIVTSTGQQLSAMEEISASTDALSKMAQELQEQIQSFKL